MTSTIFDVAKQAGVSIGTVSRVLNNRDRVHPDTRERVLKAVSELNYQRNALAQSLATQQTYMLGLVIPMVNDPFYFEIVRGVEDAASAANYSLLIASHPYPNAQHDFLKLFRPGYVEAMVLVGADVPTHEIGQVMEQGVCVVLVQQNAGATIPSFFVDNYSGACSMAEHLIGLGYQRIAYIAGTDFTTDSSERFRGLQDTLFKHHLDIAQEYVVQGNYLRGSGYTAMQQLLHLPVCPQAVFAANDQMAIDAIQAIHECGLRVPEDIAVVGFDDISLCQYVSPALTTVAQPSYELGFQAAAHALEIAQAQKANRTIEPKHVQLSTRLVVRRSCGAKSEH